jgi:hypothetical protein
MEKFLPGKMVKRRKAGAKTYRNHKAMKSGGGEEAGTITGSRRRKKKRRAKYSCP